MHKGVDNSRRGLAQVLAATLGLAAFAHGGGASAAGVSQVSPQGEVAEVRQVTVRFDSAVVAAGDPHAAAPFALQCNGRTPPADARWLDDRNWVLDLRQPLAAGQRCTLQAAPGFTPLGGPITGPSRPGIVSQVVAEMSSSLRTPRSSSSRPTGTIMAPPMPCTIRAATSAPKLSAAPQAAEAALKTTIAIRKTRLAPKRSATQPEAGMKTVSATR